MMSHSLLEIKGLGPAYYKRIIQGMERENLSLEELRLLDPIEIKQKTGVPINIANALKNTAVYVNHQHSKMKRSISLPSVTEPIDSEHYLIVNREDNRYPKKLKTVLGDKAPETLYIWGNLDLFDRPSVGFCGSRDVSQKGLTVTKDICEQISALGWVTVSGHARGVDITSHRTALENNSGTIIVLPEGINGFKLRIELRKYATSDNLLIISEFSPNAGWNVGYAMQRNTTIIGLSDAMVLVESRDQGGTFNAGKTALRLRHPLFVVRFQDVQKNNSGNDYFLQQGAYQLMKSQLTNKANTEALIEKVKHTQIHSHLDKKTAPRQLAIPFEVEENR